MRSSTSVESLIDSYDLQAWLAVRTCCVSFLCYDRSVYIVILICYERQGILITFIIEVHCMGKRYPGNLVCGCDYLLLCLAYVWVCLFAAFSIELRQA